jgi:hypothetical protein
MSNVTPVGKFNPAAVVALALVVKTVCTITKLAAIPLANGGAVCACFLCAHLAFARSDNRFRVAVLMWRAGAALFVEAAFLTTGFFTDTHRLR